MKRPSIEDRVAKLDWLQPHALFPNGRITAPLHALDLFPVVSDEPAINRLRAGAPLEEWFVFFDTRHRVSVYLPDETDAEFQKFLNRLVEYSRKTSAPELQTLSFQSGVVGDPPSPMPAYAVCSGGCSPFGSVFSATVPANETVVSDDAFRPWLKAADSARALRQISPPAGAWLERLRTVRNEIGGLKVSEAAQYLENRTSSTVRKINVLGATVEERLAIVAAPTAAFLTLFYLLLLTSHLARMPKNSMDAAKQFPWVAIFPDLLSRFVAYTSLWLPFGLCVWLFSDCQSSASVPVNVTVPVLLTAIGAAATVASHRLYRLREKLLD